MSRAQASFFLADTLPCIQSRILRNSQLLDGNYNLCVLQWSSAGRNHEGNEKHVPPMTFSFMFRLELPLCRLGLVNSRCKKTRIMLSARRGLIQPMKLFPPPLHLCLYIILKRQSAFPSCSLILSVPHSPTHWHAQQCAQPLSGAHSWTRSRHRTHVMDTHAHRLSERTRDPKHQNSINPPRRSLKGFLKADFQHTGAFRVSTVCGGNGAEAFKLHTLTFPLCYFLFLSLTRSPSSVSLSFLISAFVPAFPSFAQGSSDLWSR